MSLADDRSWTDSVLVSFPWLTCMYTVGWTYTISSPPSNKQRCARRKRSKYAVVYNFIWLDTRGFAYLTPLSSPCYNGGRWWRERKAPVGLPPLELWDTKIREYQKWKYRGATCNFKIIWRLECCLAFLSSITNALNFCVIRKICKTLIVLSYFTLVLFPFLIFYNSSFWKFTLSRDLQRPCCL